MIYLLILPPETKENKSSPLFMFNTLNYINAMIKLASRFAFQTRCDPFLQVSAFFTWISFPTIMVTLPESTPLEHCLKVFLKNLFSPHLC